MEGPFDTNAFISNFLDSSFDESLGCGSMTGLPTGSSSASPQVQQLSLLSNGSVDSGIALDMDNDMNDMNDMPQGRRGSSEEKDNMTPAQSRRKAQNRVA
jgi:AP-1-like factor